MTDGLDLNAYLARICYSGSRAPTLETLKAVVIAHADAVTFENLNPFLGLPVKLDLASLQAKVVHGGRGGYCFELNGLLFAALRAMGYRVTGLGGRVIWNQPVETVSPRTHMIIRVDMDDGVRLVDVGLGGMTLTGVLDMVPDTVQTTPREPFRLVEEGGDWAGWLRVEAKIGSEWRATCRFDQTIQRPIDYEVANHYTSTSPASYFTQMLVAARLGPVGRRVLRNTELGLHRLDGPSERQALTSVAEVEDALRDVFGLSLPDRTLLRERVARLL
jgi:N-hydroxyarylamine O-acetyltransferase